MAGYPDYTPPSSGGGGAGGSTTYAIDAAGAVIDFDGVSDTYSLGVNAVISAHPDGTVYVTTAAEGDTVCVTDHLGTLDPADSGIYTAHVGAAWERVSTSVGDLAMPVDMDSHPDKLAALLVQTPAHGWEFPLIGYTRQAIGLHAATATRTADFDIKVESSNVSGLELVDASGGAIVAACQTVASGPGRTVIVRKTDSSANTVTINPAGTETIGGAATLVLSRQDETVIIRATTTGWDVIGGTAEHIDYDNTTSGLTATKVGAAIDELVASRRKAPLATSYDTGFSGIYGALPWDSFGNVSAEAYAAGTMIGGWCDVTGPITSLQFEISATSLTSGQSVILACYANDANGKPTGTPLWTETKVVGTATGVQTITLTRDLPTDGCSLWLLNPSGNSGSVTIYNYQPTGPYYTVTRAVTNRPALQIASMAAAPDLTNYKYNNATGASAMVYNQRMPMLFLKS